MKKLIAVLLFSCFFYAGAQSINDYKYVVVDNQYEFQNEANEYRLNELMVFELKKYGFNAYRNSEILPADLNRGLCNSLKLNVYKSGWLSTELYAELVNCDGEVLFTTPSARSNTKDFRKDYFSTVRESFKSFEDLNYQYTGDDQYIAPTRLLTIQEEQQLNKAKETKPKENKTVDVTAEEKSKTTPDNLKEASSALPEAIKMDYEDKTITGLSIKFDNSKDTFQLFKNGEVVGSGRKSAAGVYLITAESFTGLGFQDGNNFVIEFDQNGTTQRIVLAKK
ncbi:hypothetical protein [Nonlabens sp. YIK11]|uniref:hypothetical protein n=1 Tax=Nonlabens sp. YIK11 TaxID=1453349 RepID=UPI0006DCD9CF|nr:hypothetical protein [Nonlabens sp. YIK11]